MSSTLKLSEESMKLLILAISFLLTLAISVIFMSKPANAAYYFLDDVSSSYENQSTSQRVVGVDINLRTYQTSSLFKTYLVCPTVETDYGDFELITEGCVNQQVDGFNNGNYYDGTVNTATRLIYPGANTVNCLIFTTQEGIQWCSDSARINYTGNVFPVYRFWSENNKRHFFTIEHSEKKMVIDQYSEREWEYEQLAWSAKKFNGVACEPSETPVFRFWSDTQKGHFYTNNSAERDHIQRTYPTNVWKYEGVAYCTAPYNGSCSAGLSPIYRFWSDTQRGHFYTISSDEKNHIQATYPTSVWRYEGIAFCGYI